MSWFDRVAIALRPWRRRLTNAFFSHFFRLVVAAISLSQWAVVWWMFASRIEHLPWLIHVAVPVVVYAGNRRLAGYLQQRRRQDAPTPLGLLPRLYYALALTSLFCSAFLLLTGALWLSAKVCLEALTVQAWTLHAGALVDSGINTGFRWITNAGLVLIGTVFAYGYTIGQRRWRVSHVPLSLSGWSGALDGLRIVQISDIHIGQHLELATLERFVERINALCPDIICITGDIVDGPAADIEGFLPILARLRAAGGIFAILGNHDHYAGAERVQAALQRLTPFTVLRDEHASIDVRGARMHIVGLDDHPRDWARGATHVSYLQAALALLPADEPVLLLSHRPDIFRQAARAGVALTLSGHTHGGQLGFPWFRGRVRNLAEFITRYDRGLFRLDRSFLYVNAGLGVTAQPIRLCTPREITVLELRQEAQMHAAA